MEGQHESIRKMLVDVTTPTKQEEPQSSIPPVIDDLDEEQEQKPAMASTGENGGEGSAAAPPKVNEKLLTASADATIAVFDFTQNNLFKWFGKIKRKRKMRRAFGDEWEASLESAKSKLEMASVNKASATGTEVIEVFTKDDVGILRVEKSFDDYFDGLPLTDEEIEAIKTPLKEIMRLKGGTIPSEYLLMLTMLQIFGARGMELFDA